MSLEAARVIVQKLGRRPVGEHGLAKEVYPYLSLEKRINTLSFMAFPAAGLITLFHVTELLTRFICSFTKRGKER